MQAEVLDNLSGRLHHEVHLVRRQVAARLVLFGCIQCWYQHRLIDLRERMPPEVRFYQLYGFVLVLSHEALVVAGMRLEYGLITEQDTEEFQLGNVATEDSQGDRQRCRQQEANGSP